MNCPGSFTKHTKAPSFDRTSTATTIQWVTRRGENTLKEGGQNLSLFKYPIARGFH